MKKRDTNVEADWTAFMMNVFWRSPSHMLYEVMVGNALH